MNKHTKKIIEILKKELEKEKGKLASFDKYLDARENRSFSFWVKNIVDIENALNHVHYLEETSENFLKIKDAFLRFNYTLKTRDGMSFEEITEIFKPSFFKVSKKGNKMDHSKFNENLKVSQENLEFFSKKGIQNPELEETHKEIVNLLCYVRDLKGMEDIRDFAKNLIMERY